LDIFVVGLGETACDTAYGLVHQLRRSGLGAAMDIEGRSLKSQMKQANKNGADYVCIIGDDELQKGLVVLRDMKSQEQEELPMDTAEADFHSLTELLVNRIKQ
ncbi:MAG: His/Gly/Thr/Pro-type tRNA ligase C-terminal domain-containing protein, partial [Thermodesulfobacteriota bacterium]